MSKRSLPASENVLSMIHVLSNRVTRAFSTEVEPKFDITLAEWPVIVMLSQRPRATANEVTQSWSMEKMTVNRAIRKLEAAGAISRTRKKHDKRSYELNLTKRGNLTGGECSISPNYIRLGTDRTVELEECKSTAGEN